MAHQIRDILVIMGKFGFIAPPTERREDVEEEGLLERLCHLGLINDTRKAPFSVRHSF